MIPIILAHLGIAKVGLFGNTAKRRAGHEARHDGLAQASHHLRVHLSNPEVCLHYQSELGSLLITRMPFHCALSKYCIQTIRESSELCRVDIKSECTHVPAFFHSAVAISIVRVHKLAEQVHVPGVYFHQPANSNTKLSAVKLS